MRIIFGILLFLFFSCETTAQYSLQKQWETARDLRTPESVLYQPGENVLYVSNINGRPTEKDSNGFISKVSLQGEILQLKWADGLNAPKGSCIFGDRFYVTDIDHLIEIDLKNGKILHRYPAPGALFLNDAAVDAAGTVYISDSSEKNSVIYKFGEGQISVWLKGDQISRPNGLLIQKDRLIFGNSGDGTIKAVSLTDKKITPVAKVGWGIDGLKQTADGNFITSDWAGRTSLVTGRGKIIPLLNTIDAKINAADLEYISSQKLVVIPTFFDNRLVAYKLLKK